MTEDILYILMTTGKFYKMNNMSINVEKIEGNIAAGDLVGVDYKDGSYKQALLFSLPNMTGDDLCVSLYEEKENNICHLYDLLADEEVINIFSITNFDEILNIKSF